MFIVEGSKRRIIASLIVICFIVSSCFSVLSEVVYAAEQNLGKKEKSVSENVTGDVEEGNFSIEQNIKKYVPYEANGKKGIILQTEIATTIDVSKDIKKEELNLKAVELKNTRIEKVIVNNKNNSNFYWNFNEDNKR